MDKKPFGVLILHGFTSSLDCVREIEPPLKALGLPTRMPVLRGHNAASPEALQGVTWHDWMADADAALHDLLTEADKAIVIGHSMGGLVALNLAADHGSQIDSLILAAPAIQLTSPVAPGKPFNFIAPAIPLLFKKWAVKQDAYADPTLAQYNTNYLWAPTHSILELFALIKSTRKRLVEVKAPLLIIQSHKDTTVAPETVEILNHEVSTPASMRKTVWFEVTEHEMFRDSERYAIIDVITNYIKGRVGIAQP